MLANKLSDTLGVENLPRPKTPWDTVPVARWEDWRWQLANRIGRLEELRDVLRLTPEEDAGIALASQRFRLEITPYFAKLMDPDDPACPIRRQVIPTIAELATTPSESEDPLAEAQYTPVPGIIHRYPDRVLLLPTLLPILHAESDRRPYRGHGSFQRARTGIRLPPYPSQNSRCAGVRRGPVDYR